MRFFVRWLVRLALVLIVAIAGFSFYLTTLGPDPVDKPERQMSEVWADYPYESHYVSVNGSKMHYIDVGPADGPVFLFLHGNPTSSYLWRKTVSVVAASGARVIAVDNIGFGASDRPDIGYTFIEHAAYIDGFIAQLGLRDITLVIHDWGSALGFDYAFRNPDNVQGLVFMEAITQVPPPMSDLEPVPRVMFGLFRTPGIGEFLVMGLNGFIDQVLPMSVIRELSEAEMAAYREPFPSLGSRLPVLVWPRQIPFGGKPADVAARVEAYAQWLPTSRVPKLFFHVDPGALIDEAAAQDIIESWTNIEGVDLGEGLHFIQEDHGDAIGAAIVDWHGRMQPDPAADRPAPDPAMGTEDGLLPEPDEVFGAAPDDAPDDAEASPDAEPVPDPKTGPE